MVKKASKGGESMNNKLALVMKSGKVTLGYKTTLKSLRQGKAKLVFLCNNAPPVRRSEIEYYCMLSKTQVIYYSGNNIDFGRACGKHFRVSSLAILDEGDSDIMVSQ